LYFYHCPNVIIVGSQGKDKDGTCCTYAEKRSSGGEYLKEEDHLEDLRVDESIILKWVLKE
jgi:hypothetical protein